MSFTQFNPQGHLRHLITLEGLGAPLLTTLLDRADALVRPLGAAPARSQALAGVTVGNLFTEPSTRTRASFELAGKRLGADVVNLEIQLSSRVKGETMLDTISTLQAIGVDLFIIRDAEAGVHEYVAGHVHNHVSIISAGESHLSHPTQGLLDALTLRQHCGGFAGRTVTIVGDLRHSRVARSAYHALTTLGIGELRLCGPAPLMPPAGEFHRARRCTTLNEGLEGTDVVMMLRIQKERMADALIPERADYHAQWGLTPERLARARPDCLVMHPGPMNRGVEIDSTVADGPQSAIQRQVTNGVAVRMAVLEHIAAGRLRHV
jgi:aspartate carbamoyltransferase catalytic subunit